MTSTRTKAPAPSPRRAAGNRPAGKGDAATSAQHAKKARDYRRALEKHVRDVRMFLHALDVEMRGPSTAERGRQIARLTNILEMANDIVDRFVLGNIRPRRSRT